MAVEAVKRIFSVEEYHRMHGAGILGEDDRVELLDGELFEMTPISSRHAAAVKRLLHLFAARVAGRAIVSIQDPIGLGGVSEPQPDLCLLAPRDDFYASAHPTAADVLLLVEVSDTSQAYDRNVKLPLYARHGIREVWLLDLASSRLTVFRDPSDGGYASAVHPGPEEPIAPQALPDLTFHLRDLLS
jgi:hypothetical protein